MTITSKPSDGESIVERVNGPLGSEWLVASPALCAFFDEIATQLNLDPSLLRQAFHLALSMQVSMPAIYSAIEQQKTMAANVDGETRALTGRLRADHSSLLKRVENLEHLCQSNLVR